MENVIIIIRLSLSHNEWLTSIILKNKYNIYVNSLFLLKTETVLKQPFSLKLFFNFKEEEKAL